MARGAAARAVKARLAAGLTVAVAGDSSDDMTAITGRGLHLSVISYHHQAMARN